MDYLKLDGYNKLAIEVVSERTLCINSHKLCWSDWDIISLIFGNYLKQGRCNE